MNFLVAEVTKLPPIKVPYSKQPLGAAALVRSRRGRVDTGRARAGGGGGSPSHALIQILAVGSGRQVERAEKPIDAFLFHFLGSWWSRARAAAPRPGLHQPDGDRVRPHAPGIFSRTSGPGAVQGPGVCAAKEVSQSGETLAETLVAAA